MTTAASSTTADGVGTPLLPQTLTTAGSYQQVMAFTSCSIHIAGNAGGDNAFLDICKNLSLKASKDEFYHKLRHIHDNHPRLYNHLMTNNGNLLREMTFLYGMSHLLATPLGIPHSNAVEQENGHVKGARRSHVMQVISKILQRMSRQHERASACRMQLERENREVCPVHVQKAEQRAKDLKGWVGNIM